jgi:hypothetical protein
MSLSAEARHLLLAYDSFTDFAGGPDLPWVVEVYETLEDDSIRRMIWALSYAWAVGQRAAGCYEDSIESLAQSLFLKLPTWDDRWSQDEKAAWLNQLGVQMIVPEPEPRPIPSPEDNRYPQRWGELAATERSAVEHMAAFFNLGLPETILLYHLSQALQQHDTPIDAVPLQLEMPQPQAKAVNGF